MVCWRVNSELLESCFYPTSQHFNTTQHTDQALAQHHGNPRCSCVFGAIATHCWHSASPGKLCQPSKSHSRFIKAPEWHVILPSFMGCLWSLQRDNISWQLSLYCNSLHLGKAFHQWISQSCTSDRLGFFLIVCLYKSRFHVLTPLFHLVVKAISFLISMSHLTASHQLHCVNFCLLFLEMKLSGAE